MKILIIKEIIDELGSYDSFNYVDISFETICDNFKTKANGIHSIFAFKTDYAIINNKKTKYNYKQKLYEHNNVINFIRNNTKKCFNVNNINFSNWDIIWCRDDILFDINKIKNDHPKTLFVYENIEHAFSIINNCYDLILDHTNFSFQIPNSLNTVVSFPYPIDFNILRTNIDCNKTIDIYIDSRVIYATNQNILTLYNNYIEYFNEFSLSLCSNIPRPEICYNNINKESDCKKYLEKIGRSKYFVLTVPRLGQSLVEAAALNCIVIGIKQNMHSKIICHKECIFNNPTFKEEIKSKILYLESKPELQKEILEYQDKMLTKYYYEHQKNVLQKALELKKKCF